MKRIVSIVVAGIISVIAAAAPAQGHERHRPPAPARPVPVRPSHGWRAPAPCSPMLWRHPVYPAPVPLALVRVAPPRYGPCPVVVRYVERPVTVIHPVSTAETVWILNSNGSRTPVELRRADGGLYVGPRGEYYTGLPTNEQLRQLYGL